MFGLEPSELTLIDSVLRAYPKVTGAVVFGSRAKGNFRKYSDVDIAVFGELSGFEAQAIADELDELPLIYKFDVVAHSAISNQQLVEHIDRVGVPIMPARSAA